MNKSDFEYDVAFSFLDKDHPLAVAIREKLTDAVSVFVYSERQAELAGKDGETTFNEVFGGKARLVVVLYREGWGESPWTRIEKTAIQNRAMDEGYDFTVFVLLESKIIPLQWIPKNRIWYNYPKFGIDGLAASIEARIQELGGNTKSPSVEDRAASANIALAGLRKRTEFLDSEKAVKPANDEAHALILSLEAKSKTVSDSNPELAIRIQRPSRELELYCLGLRLVVVWDISFTNSLRDSSLLAYFAEIRRDKISFDPVYQDILQREFTFWINESDDPGWREKHTKKFFTTSDLADHLLTELIQRVKSSRLKHLDP